MSNAAVEAIKFALDQGLDGLSFLNAWLHGDFDVLRREWPEAPEDVYPVIGEVLDQKVPLPNGEYVLMYPTSTSEIEGDSNVQEVTFKVTFDQDNKVSPETLLGGAQSSQLGHRFGAPQS
ncbi:hypothetical protein H1O16_gp377 [Burkholderia phage BcepSaruman]|uniref:Uncharacterized protein n=1 Tax=Burkholderia phage BcepSaruman TaxID=2530032 RepID=A0A4D5ZDL1_9CAUD|nr:hypothetical protein H1O16_gp377 [Burkholderia phage BcepSaruman]QBX06790.1 hypothetical protein BcepSaruman_377 [Burkholderia phage BcepSaruman]